MQTPQGKQKFNQFCSMSVGALCKYLSDVHFNKYEVQIYRDKSIWTLVDSESAVEHLPNVAYLKHGGSWYELSHGSEKSKKSQGSFNVGEFQSEFDQLEADQGKLKKLAKKHGACLESDPVTNIFMKTKVTGHDFAFALRVIDVFCGAVDDNKFLCTDEAAELIFGVDFVKRVKKLHTVLSNDSNGKIVVRRTGETGGCIPFHCDNSTSPTLQLTLSHDCVGGETVYVFSDPPIRVVPPEQKEPGTVIIHGPHVLHGTKAITHGTRYRMYVLSNDTELEPDTKEINLTNLNQRIVHNHGFA